MPDITGENRNEQGRFMPGISGNPAGRPRGGFSITGMIKEKLQEIPENYKETYLELIVRQILNRAVRGDFHMIKQLWQQLDGLPKRAIETRDDEPKRFIITDCVDDVVITTVN